MSTQVNLTSVVDEAKLRPVHLQVFFICLATAMVDGADVQMLGFSASAISADLHIPMAAFGPIFSATAAGSLAGALCLGAVADRFGRKASLVLCTTVFAIFTLATIGAASASHLLLLRFLAGIGLGGAVPNFLTLVAEYAPKSRRGLAAGVLWCGYPLGGMLGSAIGSYMLPTHGWRAVFALGGGLAMGVACLQLVLLPESVQFLALRGGSHDRIARIVRRLDPGRLLAGVSFVTDRSLKRAKVPIGLLFSEGRLPVTLLVWAVFFCTFMLTNFFVLWTPALFRQSGQSLSTAAMMITLINFSSIPGETTTGFAIDKVGPFKPVLFSFLALAAAIAAMAFALDVVPAIAVLMVVIGFVQAPGIVGMIFIATRIYPIEMRSTGVGWGFGAGRIGQMLGSLIVGLAVGANFSPSSIFLAMTVPALVAACCIVLLQVRITGTDAMSNLVKHQAAA